MGKPKKYLTKSVNLGEVGNPARILSEKYLKKYGKQEFSALVRKLIVIFLSNNKDFLDWKKEALIFERKNIAKEIEKLSEKMCLNADMLEELGIDVKEI